MSPIHLGHSQLHTVIGCEESCCLSRCEVAKNEPKELLSSFYLVLRSFTENPKDQQQSDNVKFSAL